MARTRIVATLGPATDSAEAIRNLIAAGVNVFRLNFSHGTREQHAQRIGWIREVAGPRPVAILQDLGGPKLRLSRAVRGEPGEVIDVDVLPPGVRPGDPVLLADGAMHLEVVAGTRCRVVVGGEIPAGKGVNLPSSRIALPALTDKDRGDLAFGTAEGVDLVALSFVGSAVDIEDARRISDLPIIAKVERASAVERLEEIVEAADGVLVARGDLGVEIPIERVPTVQKRMIALANRAAKPVVTATQMLRSMVTSPVPTRAEATDVANAVLDGSDAVMLSEETAVGRYPGEAVRMMRRILAEAEGLLADRLAEPSDAPADLVAHAACRIAARLDAWAIVVATRTGFTARAVARHRPRMPIVALTPSEAVRRWLSLVWGVTAVTVPWYDEPEAVLRNFRAPLREHELAPPGARVVVTTSFDHPGETNLLHVATV